MNPNKNMAHAHENIYCRSLTICWKMPSANCPVKSSDLRHHPVITLNSLVRLLKASITASSEALTLRTEVLEHLRVIAPQAPEVQRAPQAPEVRSTSGAP